MQSVKACNAFRMRAVFSDFTFEHVKQGGERMERDGKGP